MLGSLPARAAAVLLAVAAAACGGSGNRPPPDAGAVTDGGLEAGAATDSGPPPGSDGGPPPGSDAGWVIPPGCGLPEVSLATLGFAPVVPPGTAITGAPIPALVTAVEPARLTLLRGDTGADYYFRTAGPSLAGAFAPGETVALRSSVDPVTQLATHVVEEPGGGATRAAVLFLFGDTLPPPNASSTGTGAQLAYGPTCLFPDARETCGRAVLDVERRSIDATGTAGTLTLWAGDQGFRDGWIITVVDALVLPGYAVGGCALAASVYLGVTFLPAP